MHRTLQVHWSGIEGRNLLTPASDERKRPDSAILSGILILVVLYFARDVLVPLALAGLIAFALAPAAQRLERLGLKRAPAALIVIFLSLAGMSVLGWILVGQVYSLAMEIPQYQQNIQEKVGSLHLESAGKLSSTVQIFNNLNQRIHVDTAAVTPLIPVAPLKFVSPRHKKAAPPVDAPAKPAEPVTVRVEAPEESMLDFAARTLTPLLHPLTTTFIVVIFLVFMLIGREDIRDRSLKLAGSERMHVTTTAIKDATVRVSRYLQMQMVVNISYGAVIGVALGLIGVPHPLLWGVLTCILRFVPYVGIMMAAAGPLLLAGAISPHWDKMIWTTVTFGVLEMVAANFIEPMLYSASTGISALAVLIAAVFWTFLWGLPGLLLSTPLTVCLIVIGRQVPRLRYLDVLFGERTGLPPSEHFYQRMLASNVRDARTLLEITLKRHSPTETFDSVVIPALAMIEEARHSEEMTAARTEEILQAIEELLDDLSITGRSEPEHDDHSARNVICIPARDFADEVACQLAERALQNVATVHITPVNGSIATVQELVGRVKPELICVVGIPPRAIRHIKMRCHQIKARFPDCIVVACILGEEKELSSLRSRIPTEDAQHVVSSLQLLSDYLTSVLHPAALHAELAPEDERAPDRHEKVLEVQEPDPFDGPIEGIFDRLTISLAKAFDAPIALITAADGERHFWEAQCGLAEDIFSSNGAQRDCSVCSQLAFSGSVTVIADTAEDPRFADDLFLKEHGIRFCVVAPLKDHDETVMGSVCVLDTRPRQITEKQNQVLLSTAESVLTAIEMGEPVSMDEVGLAEEISSN